MCTNKSLCPTGQPAVWVCRSLARGSWLGCREAQRRVQRNKEVKHQEGNGFVVLWWSSCGKWLKIPVHGWSQKNPEYPGEKLWIHHPSMNRKTKKWRKISLFMMRPKCLCSSRKCVVMCVSTCLTCWWPVYLNQLNLSGDASKVLEVCWRLHLWTTSLVSDYVPVTQCYIGNLGLLQRYRSECVTVRIKNTTHTHK